MNSSSETTPIPSPLETANQTASRLPTVIGALGAGGIGLLLLQTMRTSRDWENTLYIIVVTIVLVIIVDTLSGRLRKKLISG